MRDEFGDRMKGYEAVSTAVTLDPMLPVYARLDGRSFSKLTKGLDRPFDRRMSRIMIDVTKYLVQETHAAIGYTQSDEISLVWNYSPDSEPLFGGKVQKLSSVLAGIASSKFAVAWDRLFGDNSGAHFDCRILNLPNKSEATNMVLWRTQDGARNAISMAASAHFSHKELQGVSTADRVKMLAERGIAVDDYPVFFKWGTFVRRVPRETTVGPYDFLHIPDDHRPAIGSIITRTFVEEIDMPDKFSKVSNREKFMFDGEGPYVGWNNV